MPQSTTVQSLIFSKDKFDSAANAKKWATDHDFRADKVDETEDSFRLRQRDPGDFRPDSFRTIKLADGVSAVIGKLKEAGKGILCVETKTVLLKLSDVNEEGVIEGYASVFKNKDRNGEVVDKGAFKKTLNDGKKVPLLWQHDPSDPIGPVEEAKEDDTGLRIKAQILQTIQRGREALAIVKAGIVKGMSIGYRVLQDEWDHAEGVRHIKEVDLWEVSLVTFPANVEAQIRSVKEGDPLTRAEACRRILNCSDEADGDLAEDLRLAAAAILSEPPTRHSAEGDRQPEAAPRADFTFLEEIISTSRRP